MLPAQFERLVGAAAALDASLLFAVTFDTGAVVVVVDVVADACGIAVDVGRVVVEVGLSVDWLPRCRSVVDVVEVAGVCTGMVEGGVVGCDATTAVVVVGDGRLPVTRRVVVVVVGGTVALVVVVGATSVVVDDGASGADRADPFTRVSSPPAAPGRELGGSGRFRRQVRFLQLPVQTSPPGSPVLRRGPRRIWPPTPWLLR